MTVTPFLMRIHLLKNIEVECATILRKNPRLKLLKGILFCVLKITCVLKIQNGTHSL